MAHVTATRVALAAAALAALAPALPPTPAMDATVIAAAGLLGAAFVAYLAVVDRPGAAVLARAAIFATAGLLVLADAALRFPDVLAGGGPVAADRLAWAALAIALPTGLPAVRAAASRMIRSRLAGRAVGAH